ncbi:MAG: hypothetical protein ACSLFM_03405 [Tepidiformaceae bacterium]
MTPAAVSDAIAALDSSPVPAVIRFDSGQPFSGRVALLSSAFNPPTFAHLALLDVAARHDMPAALLSTKNVDKGLFGANLPHRVGMLLAASAAAATPFAVMATNAARFVDQARAVRSAYPGVPFDFVVGFDTLVRIFDARYYEDMAPDLDELFVHHRVIATNRAEASTDEVDRYLAAPPAVAFRDRVIVEGLADGHALLSSSAARSEIEVHGVTGVVPRAVADYIREHRLYRPG